MRAPLSGPHVKISSHQQFFPSSPLKNFSSLLLSSVSPLSDISSLPFLSLPLSHSLSFPLSPHGRGGVAGSRRRAARPRRRRWELAAGGAAEEPAPGAGGALRDEQVAAGAGSVWRGASGGGGWRRATAGQRRVERVRRRGPSLTRIWRWL